MGRFGSVRVAFGRVWWRVESVLGTFGRVWERFRSVWRRLATLESVSESLAAFWKHLNAF